MAYGSRRALTLAAGFTAAGLLASCADPIVPAGASLMTYNVVAKYPHDRSAFTQGLVVDDGDFFEGTGLYGASQIRQVDLESGNVLRRSDLAPDYFGEGITVFGDRIYQLTWKAGKGFIYDRNTFAVLDEFAYQGEGWGLTHDGTHLIMSDGTAVLRFLDPETLEEVRRVTVRDKHGPIRKLNELEFVKCEILANVWLQDYIVRIAPDTGEVLGWVDMHGLLAQTDNDDGADVLNGIAYDTERDRLFVTGKLWSNLFEIELVAVE